MCRVERSERKSEYRDRDREMGLLKGGESRLEKLKGSRMKMWMIRATTSVLLWTCIVQLTAIGEMWGPRVLTGWPSCFSHESGVVMDALQDNVPAVSARVLPPKSESLCLRILRFLLFFFFSFLFFFCLWEMEMDRMGTVCWGEVAFSSEVFPFKV